MISVLIFLLLIAFGAIIGGYLLYNYSKTVDDDGKPQESNLFEVLALVLMIGGVITAFYLVVQIIKEHREGNKGGSSQSLLNDDMSSTSSTSSIGE
jgi:TRAP-type C4-dicarboxylate transport system permease small subunit